MLYIIMNLTQLERIKMELKQRIYGENKFAGARTRLNVDFRG
jgi:hypothetical protein